MVQKHLFTGGKELFKWGNQLTKGGKYSLPERRFANGLQTFTLTHIKFANQWEK